jgi:hypothetical protein
MVVWTSIFDGLGVLKMLIFLRRKRVASYLICWQSTQVALCSVEINVMG